MIPAGSSQTLVQGESLLRRGALEESDCLFDSRELLVERKANIAPAPDDTISILLVANLGLYYISVTAWVCSDRVSGFENILERDNIGRRY